MTVSRIRRSPRLRPASSHPGREWKSLRRGTNPVDYRGTGPVRGEICVISGRESGLFQLVSMSSAPMSRCAGREHHFGGAVSHSKSVCYRTAALWRGAYRLLLRVSGPSQSLFPQRERNICRNYRKCTRSPWEASPSLVPPVCPARPQRSRARGDQSYGNHSPAAWHVGIRGTAE
jgi:hypothetical protein